MRQHGAGLRAFGALQGTGLEKWNLTGSERVPEDFLQHEVLGHPAFAQAQNTAMAGALAFCDSHTEFQATISDMGSFFLCVLALYLDASGGIVHRRLRELTGGSGILSAGRASAILWRLRHGNFIEPAPQADGASRFVPTVMMRRAFQDRMRADYDALLLMEPGLVRMLERIDSPLVFNAFIQQMGEDFLASVSRPDPHLGDFLTVAARSYGCIIMYAVALAPEVPQVAPLARRFGVSRSHVLRIFRHMESLGYLETRGEERLVTPLFRRLLARFQGLVFAGELSAAHKALLTLDGDEPLLPALDRVEDLQDS